MFLKIARAGQTTQSISDQMGQAISTSVSYIEATGGSVTEDGDYKVHTFPLQELLR